MCNLPTRQLVVIGTWLLNIINKCGGTISSGGGKTIIRNLIVLVVE